VITNPTRQIVAAFDALPEIKNKPQKNSGVGMMAPLLKRSKPEKNKMEGEPAYSVAKMYQRIKRDRMQIKGTRSSND
jgi:hypothetical protein